jgi:hypothetical protein
MTEQQVWNASYNSTLGDLRAISASGTVVGNAPQGLRSEESIMNSAFNGADSIRFLFT